MRLKVRRISGLYGSEYVLKSRLKYDMTPLT